MRGRRTYPEKVRPNQGISEWQIFFSTRPSENSNTLAAPSRLCRLRCKRTYIPAGPVSHEHFERGPGFFTLVAGIDVAGSQAIIIFGNDKVAIVMWVAAAHYIKPLSGGNENCCADARYRTWGNYRETR